MSFWIPKWIINNEIAEGVPAKAFELARLAQLGWLALAGLVTRSSWATSRAPCIVLAGSIGPFRIVFKPFRIVSGALGVVFGPFSDSFRTVFGPSRTVSDDFGALSNCFRTTPLKILNFKFQLARAGARRSCSFRLSRPAPALAN